MEGRHIGNGIRTIALIVDEIATDYTSEMIQDVMNSMPSDEKLRVVVFAGKSDDSASPLEDIRVHKEIYDNIYRIAGVAGFDGYIVSLGARDPFEDKDTYGELLTKLSGVPSVFIGADFDVGLTVKYDNMPGIRDAVNLLINVNGLTNLAMLGGRDDNADALDRKVIFRECLIDNGLDYGESFCVNTDMSEDCSAEAEKLLDMNPDVQAIFCVNDAVAKGLYGVMKKRGLIPGRDIKVFGFDNTHMSGEIEPPLASIGSADITVGGKALELLTSKLDGAEVSSAVVPTRLYGRKSLDYEQYVYTSQEIVKADEAFIYRMFDDCFYRYASAKRDREGVNLRRLFYELVSRMLQAMKRRYMSREEFEELSRLVDIFMENGSLELTDIHRFMDRLDLLQAGVNTSFRQSYVNVMINRLFLRIKDNLIYVLAGQKERNVTSELEGRHRMMRFNVMATAVMDGDKAKNTDRVIRCIESVGLKDAAFFMFDEAVVCEKGRQCVFPERINLKCVVKDGEFYNTMPERQSCRMKDMFAREELSSRCGGYLAFPVFCKTSLYGVLACGIEGDTHERGELIANQLGQALYMCGC